MLFRQLCALCVLVVAGVVPAPGVLCRGLYQLVVWGPSYPLDRSGPFVMPPGASWVKGENMRALNVLVGVVLVGAGFMGGMAVDDPPVTVQEVTEIAAPGPAPVKEVPQGLVCGEYTWANADATGCEVLPDYLAQIKSPTIEYVEVIKYVPQYITEYVDRPVIEYVVAPVTVRFFEDGSYRVEETGQGDCPPMPLPLLCNSENF